MIIHTLIYYRDYAYNCIINNMRLNINIYANLIHIKAVAGLLADSRSVVDVARDECSKYRSSFGGPIPLKV